MPVAESRLRLYFAASGAIFAATGGAFWTRLWSQGTSNVGLKMPFSWVFTQGCPQTNTHTESTIHGIQPMNASAAECFLNAAAAPTDLRLAAAGAAVRSSAKRHSSLGCQTLRNRYVTMMQDAAATMSTRFGPWKLDMKNCGIAKESPGDEAGGPDAEHAAEPGHRPDEPERHDHREERQLPAGHRRERHLVQAGHLGERDDGRAERAVGDRGGVADQREAGGGERLEAEADQHRRARSRPACRSRRPPR